MRIGINFHTYDNFISGVEYYAIGLIKGLLSCDKQNTYVIYTNKPNLLDGLTSKCDNLSVCAMPNLGSRLKRILWEHLRLPWIAKRDNLDVLHCTAYVTPLIKTKIPYVVTIHDTFALENPQWCRWANRLNYSIFMPVASFKANAILAVSSQTCQKLGQRCNSLRPVVVYPGVDEEFVPERECGQEQRVKSKYRLPDHYVLYTGNVEPKKNVFSLLMAFQILKKAGLPHKLVLIGKRTWRQEHVWKFIRNSIPRDEIILAGYADRSDMPAIYRLSDAVVNTSFDEGFGFPVLEAMRCGVPVIASPVGILKELSEGSYYAINPCDIEDIASKIRFVLTTEDCIQKSSKIELARKESLRFSWLECARQTLDIYRKVAAC